MFGKITVYDNGPRIPTNLRFLAKLPFSVQRLDKKLIKNYFLCTNHAPFCQHQAVTYCRNVTNSILNIFKIKLYFKSFKVYWF